MKYLIVFSLLLTIIAGPVSGTDPALRVYLPREVTVEGPRITFDQVAICQGDAALCQKAQAVSLGAFSVAGQQIVLDRPAILSRLASCGIDSGQVTISGADRVVVRRDEKSIPPERFIAVARAFLDKQSQSARPHAVKVIQRPQPWVLPITSAQVTLRPHDATYAVRGTQRVRVDIVQNGQIVGHRDVAFALRYQHPQAVAAVDLAPGTVLTMDNTKITSIDSDRPPTPGWRAPFGQIIQRPIRAGEPIPETLIAPPEPPVLIRSRQMVVVRLETPALVVSWIGQALDEGRLGQLIKVRMGAARNGRIITARVQQDGTVEPYHEGISL